MERIIPNIMKPEPTETEQRSAATETAAPYGYCPKCSAIGASRERRPNGNDRCTAGHTYASASALKTLPEGATPKKETARFENVNEGLCPSCNTQMRLSVANGIPVHVCMQHSVVMPLRDAEPLNV